MTAAASLLEIDLPWGPTLLVAFAVFVALVTALVLLECATFRPYRPAAKRSRRLGHTTFDARKLPDRIDALVIGSGQGGLACAAVLAQFGLKVVVCEQHEVTGGGAHTFAVAGQSAKYRFNAGHHLSIPQHAQVLQLAVGAATPPVCFREFKDPDGATDRVCFAYDRGGGGEAGGGGARGGSAHGGSARPEREGGRVATAAAAAAEEDQEEDQEEDPTVAAASSGAAAAAAATGTAGAAGAADGAPYDCATPLAIKDGAWVESELCRRFPAHAVHVRRYFAVAAQVQRRFLVFAVSALLPPRWRALLLGSPAMRAWRAWAGATSAQGLRALLPGKDEGAKRLRSIATGLWLDVGSPPSRSSFFMQTAVFGGWQQAGVAYPEGSPQATSLALVEFIEARGGAVFVKCPVVEILRGREGAGGRPGNAAPAVGVRLANGTSLWAPRVVSGLGYRVTEQLLAAGGLAAAARGGGGGGGGGGGPKAKSKAQDGATAAAAGDKPEPQPQPRQEEPQEQSQEPPPPPLGGPWPLPPGKRSPLRRGEAAAAAATAAAGEGGGEGREGRGDGGDRLATQQGCGFVVANIGLRGSASALGLTKANLWVQPACAANGFDALQGIEAYMADPMGVPPELIPVGICFPSTKEAATRGGGGDHPHHHHQGGGGEEGGGGRRATQERVEEQEHHTCQMLVPAEWAWFAQHAPLAAGSGSNGGAGSNGGGEGGGKGSSSTAAPARGGPPWARHAPPHPPRRDPAGYSALKAQWAARLLHVLYRHYPRIASTPGAVAFVDVSTPLSIEHYTRPGCGAAIGLDVTPSRFVDPAEVAETGHAHPRVPGLWRAGQDYLMTGQVLAAVSGTTCALRMLGPTATARFGLRVMRLVLAPYLAAQLRRMAGSFCCFFLGRRESRGARKKGAEEEPPEAAGSRRRTKAD